MRFLVIGLLLFAGATLPSAVTTQDGLDWSLANGTGYAACFLLMLVCVFGAQGVPRGPGYLWHRDIGFAAVVLTALHVIVLLIDPAVWHYVKIGAPHYMWTGLVACLPLLALSFGAVRWARRRWPADPKVFRLVHNAWSWAMLVLLTCHVVFSGAYLPGPFSQALVILALIGLPLIAQLRGSPVDDFAWTPPNRRLTIGSTLLFLLGFVAIRAG